jgi:hypothetical protein
LSAVHRITGLGGCIVCCASCNVRHVCCTVCSRGVALAKHGIHYLAHKAPGVLRVFKSFVVVDRCIRELKGMSDRLKSRDMQPRRSPKRACFVCVANDYVYTCAQCNDSAQGTQLLAQCQLPPTASVVSL